MVYITCKNSREAENISKHLLKKRLIACANLLPIRSIYRWKGKLVDGKEVALIAKSKKQNSGKITSEVKKIHSYQIPLIEIIDSRANREYERWIEKELWP